MERIRLYRSGRQRLVGDVILDDGALILEVNDEHDRSALEKIFNETGEVTWGWTTRYGEGKWNEHRADPKTPNWLWFVVTNILPPMGYQAVGVTDETR